MCRKSFVGITIEFNGFVGSEGLLHNLRDPQQHLSEAKQFEEQLWLGAVFPFGEAKNESTPTRCATPGQIAQPSVRCNCVRFRTDNRVRPHAAAGHENVKPVRRSGLSWQT